MQDKDIYYANHYAEMLVQPIEVDQAIMSPEGFNGFLLGNAAKYHLRAGHKAGEIVDKELTKRDRYIAWLFYATKGETIDPKKDYECPEWYKESVIIIIERKVAELKMARNYGENN